MNRIVSIALLLLFSISVSAKDSITPTQAKQFSQNKQLLFVENKGQIRDQNGKARKDIQFKLATPGMNVFIGNGALHYQWYKTPKKEFKAPDAESMSAAPEEKLENIEMYRMDVSLVGANKNAELVVDEQQEYFERYFQAGADVNKGLVAHTFRKITYKNIYPNIDWVLYLTPTLPDHPYKQIASCLAMTGGEQPPVLKYDFIVHPGGNPKDIQLKYGGASKLNLSAEGDLKATNPFGSISEQKPYSYEKESGKEINSAFSLKDNVLSFTIAASEKEIVIDPTLLWSTYFGGSSTEYGCGVACDAAGNVFMVGIAATTSNIATVGAYLTTMPGGSSNTFLAKFNGSGVPQWCTYYYGIVYNGGTYNQGSNITTDPAGNVYISGYLNAGSPFSPTTGCYQSSSLGGSDAHLSKFDGTGALLWATYFGGSSTDYGEGVTCDAAGNVYLAGWTSSSSNIATAGAYQTSLVGSWNDYLSKFNSTGTLLWSTYFGGNCGSSSNWGHGIVCDPSNNVIFSGYTCATSGIATAGAYQTTLGGSYDAFLAKFNGAGSIQWATYFGGSNQEYSSNIDCDNLGNIYLGGWTYSSNNIATAGAYQTTLSGSTDTYLAKFDPSGSLFWSTYFGGPSTDWGGDVIYNNSGAVFLSGTTLSASGIATVGAYQTTFNGGTYDAFLTKFDPGTGTLLYGTYFGGPGYDWGGGMAKDGGNNIFLCGITNSTSSIATTGAYQTIAGGGSYDAFLSKWSDYYFNIVSTNDTLLCPGDTLHLYYSSNKTFNTGNAFTAQLSDSSGSFASYTTIGTVTTTANTGGIFCTIPTNAIAGTHYRFRIRSFNPVDSTMPNDIDIHIKPIPVFNATSNSPVCPGDSIKFNISSTFTGATYHWSGPGGFSSNLVNPVILSASASDTGNYYISDTLLGCIAKDTAHVSLKTLPASPSINTNSPVCLGDSIKLYSNSTTSGVNYNWSGPSSFGSTLQNPNRPNAIGAYSGSYTVTITGPNGCATSVSATVTVITFSGPPSITINTAAPDTVCAGALVTFSAFASNVSSPSYQWKKNGADISGATGTIYSSSSLNNNDLITCRVKTAASCQVPDTAISNSIKMHIVWHPAPAVSVTAFPANFKQGNPETFTAYLPGGGNGITFKWRKNGVTIPGATSSSYTTTNVKAGDTVCVLVHSAVPCTVPDSAVACWGVVSGIGNTELGIGDFKVFPNPTRGDFTISNLGNANNVNIQMQVYNMSGRKVTEQGLNFISGNADVHLDLAKGIYLLQLTAADGMKYMQTLVIY